MLSYELAKQLKDAGFPQIPIQSDGGFYMGKGSIIKELEDSIFIPTLTQLIEECGDDLWYLIGKMNDMYVVIKDGNIFQGKTREEAVANLWLELNKNK